MDLENKEEMAVVEETKADAVETATEEKPQSEWIEPVSYTHLLPSLFALEPNGNQILELLTTKCSSTQSPQA